MSHLNEFGAYRHSFLEVHEGATDLGLCGVGKDILNDGVGGEDSPVRSGRCGWRFGVVAGLVT